jgi:hypothetical protein
MPTGDQDYHLTAREAAGRTLVGGGLTDFQREQAKLKADIERNGTWMQGEPFSAIRTPSPRYEISPIDPLPMRLPDHDHLARLMGTDPSRVISDSDIYARNDLTIQLERCKCPQCLAAVGDRYWVTTQGNVICMDCGGRIVEGHIRTEKATEEYRREMERLRDMVPPDLDKKQQEFITRLLANAGEYMKNQDLSGIEWEKNSEGDFVGRYAITVPGVPEMVEADLIVEDEDV